MTNSIEDKNTYNYSDSSEPKKNNDEFLDTEVINKSNKTSASPGTINNLPENLKNYLWIKIKNTKNNNFTMSSSVSFEIKAKYKNINNFTKGNFSKILEFQKNVYDFITKCNENYRSYLDIKKKTIIVVQILEK